MARSAVVDRHAGTARRARAPLAHQRLRNSAVRRILRRAPAAAGAASDGFEDLGRVAVVRFGDPSPIPRGDRRPRLFVDGGRTRRIPYTLAAGQGPRGNQQAGTFQSVVVPRYDSRSLGMFSNSQAWVRAGTGLLTVRRSYLGVAAGNQRNGYYVTTRAAARVDQHEQTHIRNGHRLYNTHLRPLLDRVRSYTPRPTGRGRVVTRYLQGSARSALERLIDWTSSLWRFRNADNTTNGVGGTVDRAYLASPGRIFDAGPGTVSGTSYQHRIHVGTEPEPH